MNLPPTFQAYETGHVLPTFGRTDDGADLAPVVLDSRIDIPQQLQNGLDYIKPYQCVPSVTWWGPLRHLRLKALCSLISIKKHFMDCE